MLGILLILLGCLLKQLWLVMIAPLAMVAAIIFLVVFNRCPHCERYVGAGTYCPYCGKRLDE